MSNIYRCQFTGRIFSDEASRTQSEQDYLKTQVDNVFIDDAMAFKTTTSTKSVSNEIIIDTAKQIMKDNSVLFERLAAVEKKELIKMTLPTDSNERKNHPLLSGCFKYFPAALSGIANVSKKGNDKHNPGEQLHHARGKSMDHGDCILRHLLDTEDLLAAYNRDTKQVNKEQILLEANQMGWRALAYIQLLHETFGAPLAPGAK